MNKICYVVTIPLTIRAFFIPQLSYLADNGFDVTVICSNDGRIEYDLGEKIRYIPVEIPRGIAFYRSVKTIKELTSIFEKEHFDLVQYSTPNAALYASLAAKKVGIKVRNYHLMGFKYLGGHGASSLFLKSMEKISCSNSTHIECVSKSNLNWGCKEGIFDQSKAVVVWNGSSGGVELSKFDYNKRAEWRECVRAEMNYKKNDFVYGFVGRITRDKGINELIESFMSVSDSAQLLIIGTIENEQGLNSQLLKWARENPSVKFHDAVSNIEEYFAAIDVLVLPSYREGFGNVIIEAGAMGVPAIVTNIPGPIDIVEENKTALIVPPKNTVALTDAMQQIRKMNYREMGQNAINLVRTNYDSKILCKKILKRKKGLLGLNNERID